ncbi:MAG TPA: hypothetical protein VF916_09805, partial [Ktedonobacterales bacterium]
ALLPVLLVFLGYWLWRRRRDMQALLLLTILLALVGNIVVAGLASYVEFYRLRAPMDWAMIMDTSIVLLTVWSAMRAQTPKTAEHDSRAGADLASEDTRPLPSLWPTATKSRSPSRIG